MVNKNLYKYQKAIATPIKQIYHDGFYVVDWYQVKLGKMVLGNGPKDKCIPLKRELNCSHSKRAFINEWENRGKINDTLEVG